MTKSWRPSQSRSEPGKEAYIGRHRWGSSASFQFKGADFHAPQPKWVMPVKLSIARTYGYARPNPRSGG
jgi:hypothetical protein